MSYTRTSPVTLRGCDDIYTNSANLTSQFPIYNGVVAPNRSVTYGENIPGWRKLIREGKSATTSMVASDIEVNDVSASGRVVRRSGVGSVTDPFMYDREELYGSLASITGVPWDPVGIAASEADNAAKMAFVQHALRQQRALQGLVVAGEFGQTVRLIRHPALSLIKATEKLVDRVKKLPKKVSLGKTNNILQLTKRQRSALRRAGAETWLEWSFGVQPLVSDVKDAALAAARIVTYRPESVVVTGEGAGNEKVSTWGAAIFGGLLFRHSFLIEMTAETQVKYVGKVLLTNPTGPGNTALQQLGLSWRDVLPAVWEIIPYSFLVDYFLNVQGIVNALAFNKLSLAWVEKGVRRAYKNTMIDSNTIYAGLGPYQKYISRSISLPPGSSVAWVSKQRENYTGMSLVPTLEFNLPGLHSRKWLNIGALIGQKRYLTLR